MAATLRSIGPVEDDGPDLIRTRRGSNLMTNSPGVAGASWGWLTVSGSRSNGDQLSADARSGRGATGPSAIGLVS